MSRGLDLDADVAIVGSGFAGSLLATIARRLGRSVVLLERGQHPRFAIGESSTPLANLLLDDLATTYDLPRLAPFTKWGTWRREHPEVRCGLKRGFTFYHHVLDRRFAHRPDRADQLLVAASPHDAIADTHWYRADFDHFLVREARQSGVEYIDRVDLDSAVPRDDGLTLTGRCGDRDVEVRARFVIDATGPRGFLHRVLGLTEKPFEHLPPTQALYAHWRGATHLDPGTHHGGETPPYPPAAAAVHHVFDGGWIWILHFADGPTSAGVALTAGLAAELRLEEGAPAWQRLLARLPTVGELFARAEPASDFVHLPRLAFRSAEVVGRRWALLPSAAGFVDPLLSTGFPLTLLGIHRLARILADDWESDDLTPRLDAYAAATENELAAAERLIAALYAHLDDFPLFADLAKLYFAAASYTEMARRLGRPELAGGFLMHDQKTFGPRLRTITERALAEPGADEKQDLVAAIGTAIEPIDVAGLGDRRRRNWYPVDAEDLLAAADKLGASRGELKELLERSGFFASP